jgi:hypothetical protein
MCPAASIICDCKASVCSCFQGRQKRFVTFSSQRAFCDVSAAAALVARGCKSSELCARSDAARTACGCIDCRWLMAADMLQKRCRVSTCCLLLKAAGRGRQVDSSSGFQRLASCAHAGMPAPTKKTEMIHQRSRNTYFDFRRRLLSSKHCVVQARLEGWTADACWSWAKLPARNAELSPDVIKDYLNA